MDFSVESEPLQLTFQPTDESLAVNFTILEDSVPESVETFQFRLEGEFQLTQFILGSNTTATIRIVDNDRKSITYNYSTQGAS